MPASWAGVQVVAAVGDAAAEWSYGSACEHFCYQLVERPGGLQIAVLTLLA